MTAMRKQFSAPLCLPLKEESTRRIPAGNGFGSLGPAESRTGTGEKRSSGTRYVSAVEEHAVQWLANH